MSHGPQLGEELLAEDQEVLESHSDSSGWCVMNSFGFLLHGILCVCKGLQRKPTVATREGCPQRSGLAVSL